MANNQSQCGLYLISPPSFELDSFSSQLEQAFQGGTIQAFQLRLKECSDDDIVRAIEKLMPICHEYGTQFIINDRVDLAIKMQTNGVHLGSDDGNIDQALNKINKDQIIGVSCYNDLDRAIELASIGAHYVSFGAFYPTTTKIAKAKAEPELLQFWHENSTTPVVAIGGINAKNCTPLINAGADFIAVISAVWQHTDGPKAAIEEFSKALV